MHNSTLYLSFNEPFNTECLRISDIKLGCLSPCPKAKHTVLSESPRAYLCASEGQRPRVVIPGHLIELQSHCIRSLIQGGKVLTHKVSIRWWLNGSKRCTHSPAVMMNDEFYMPALQNWFVLHVVMTVNGKIIVSSSKSLRCNCCNINRYVE